MEQIETAQEKEKAKPPERVTLGKAESQRVEQWILQVSEFSKGYLGMLDFRDLLNYILLVSQGMQEYFCLVANFPYFNHSCLNRQRPRSRR